MRSFRGPRPATVENVHTENVHTENVHTENVHTENVHTENAHAVATTDRTGNH
jgi:hypothetical protein